MNACVQSRSSSSCGICSLHIQSFSQSLFFGRMIRRALPAQELFVFRARAPGRLLLGICLLFLGQFGLGLCRGLRLCSCFTPLLGSSLGLCLSFCLGLCFFLFLRHFLFWILILIICLFATFLLRRRFDAQSCQQFSTLLWGNFSLDQLEYVCHACMQGCMLNQQPCNDACMS